MKTLYLTDAEIDLLGLAIDGAIKLGLAGGVHAARQYMGIFDKLLAAATAKAPDQ